MKVYIAGFILLSLSIFSVAGVKVMDKDKTEQAIMAPINALFDAMRAHDKDKILAQFASNASLQRVEKNNQVRNSDIAKFAASIAKSDKYLDEQLLSQTISYSGNLASVWTPFVFYIDGKLSHCGVNSFQLIKTTDGWKIHHLMDNGYQGDCLDFIKQFK